MERSDNEEEKYESSRSVASTGTGAGESAAPPPGNGKISVHCCLHSSNYSSSPNSTTIFIANASYSSFVMKQHRRKATIEGGETMMKQSPRGVLHLISRASTRMIQKTGGGQMQRSLYSTSQGIIECDLIH
jgi:hypothetical protein